MHALRGPLPPGKQQEAARQRPRRLHCASQPLPGAPFSGAGVALLVALDAPVAAALGRQLALQPSHDVVLPSSHRSPGSSAPSPHAAVSPGHGGSVGSSDRHGRPGSPARDDRRQRGSRNSITLMPPPPVTQLAADRGPSAGADACSRRPTPPLVRISLGWSTVTLQPCEHRSARRRPGRPPLARITSFVTTSRPRRTMMPPSAEPDGAVGR